MYEFEKYFTINGINQYNIYDNLELIVMKLKEGRTYKFLSFLKNIYNFDFHKLLDYCDKNSVVLNYNSVAKNLIEIGNNDTLVKYLNYFIQHNSKLLELKCLLKNNGIDISSVNDFIKNNPDRVIDEIITSCKQSKAKMFEEKLDIFIKELIYELLRYEKKSIEDIEFVSRGSVTSVYLIGNKVLKIGLQRSEFNINNHRLFLKPLIRKEFYSLEDDKFLCCIEVTEKLDTNNITEEEVYNVYKTLRDDGLVWVDTNKSNVGRLLRDNKVYLDNIEYVDKVNTGYKTDNSEALPSGKLVLVDNEYIYNYKKDKNNPYVIMHLNNNEYALRYQKEKRKRRKRMSR